MRRPGMVLAVGLAVAGIAGGEVLRAHLPAVAVPATEIQLPPLQGPVVLSVSGLDPARFPDGRLQLDLQRLKAAGTTRFTTSTIWTDAGPHEFEGVTLAALLRLMGVTGGTLIASALNDYSVPIPVSDAVDDGPMIAYATDGKPMPVRDKGPLWIVYPYDANALYRSEVTYTRSIWQLESLEVQP